MSASDTPKTDKAATPAAETRPVLVLLAGGTEPGAIGPDTRLLGLTLAERARLAARRAGYATTVVRGSDGADGKSATTRPDRHRGRLIVVPANALVEVDWLKAAADVGIPKGSWAVSAGRIAAADGQAAWKTVESLAADDGLDRLQSKLLAGGKTPRGMAAAAAPMVIERDEDLPAARRRLLKALVKDTDGFMAKHVERPISIAISRWLAETPITPNQMTLVSVGFGLIGAPFFLSASPLWQTVGALLFLWHSILDGCDGELARLKFQESRWGGILDYWGDNVVHVAIFACMGVGWARAEGAAWPLILGAAAVFGTLGSAFFIYFRVMRKKQDEGPLYTSVGEGPSQGLTRLLDNASRRDFIYLVVALSLFGKASWFLVLTAIGAPVYFLLLLVVAAREARSR